MTVGTNEQTVDQVLALMRDETTGSEEARPILVGVGPDDPQGSEAAIAWAADEADARGVGLYVVAVRDWNALPTWATRSADVTSSELRDDAGRDVASAIDRVKTMHPFLNATGVVIRGVTADTLCTLAEAAEILVVGDRHRNAVDRAVLGSVGSTVAAHAPCPVVVMCGPTGRFAQPRDVVVAVDSDGSAQSVLDFGFRYARRHGRPLQALTVVPPWVFDTSDYLPPPPFAVEWLERTVAPYRGRYPDIYARTVVLVDHVVAALAAQSISEDILIVGRRGNTKHPAFHPSSVSHRVIHHAVCPVAIVPIHEDQTAEITDHGATTD